MNLTVVICHFQESLEWTTQLKHPVVVYNHNPQQADRFEHNFPNVGYDVAAYLRYIIDNYDQLPDFVCFSQDNPFVHCSGFINEVNNFDFAREFVPLGIVYVRSPSEVLDHIIEYANRNGIHYTLPIKFAAGTQCIVSRELITKNGIPFYQKILNTLPNNEVKNYTNYLVEYLWPSIFNTSL